MKFLIMLVVLAGAWHLSSTKVWYLTYEGMPHQRLPLHERLPISAGLDGSNISCLFMARAVVGSQISTVCEPVPLWRHLLAEAEAGIAASQRARES